MRPTEKLELWAPCQCLRRRSVPPNAAPLASCLLWGVAFLGDGVEQGYAF